MTRETLRFSGTRFGTHFAETIRRDRWAAAGLLPVDDVVIPINGVTHWLWRAAYAEGDVLDILARRRRNAKAARGILKKRIKPFGQPRVVATDRLSSFVALVRDAMPDADHRAHKGLNNRIEGTHRPTRRREKLLSRFKSPR
ncbi:MAG: DDE-type integrase/transposase/recombinase [Pseudomonadota bacterium]